MLRPADWLPPKRLLTPRSGHRDLSRCLGSATRRSGAYRGGTCTRWKSAASNGRLARTARAIDRRVTAHHGSILARRDSPLGPRRSADILAAGGSRPTTEGRPDRHEGRPGVSRGRRGR